MAEQDFDTLDKWEIVFNHMVKLGLYLISIIVMLALLWGIIDSNLLSKEACGCSVPALDEIDRPLSWNDTKENYDYLECAVADSPPELIGRVQRIHVFVYHNSKEDLYRCQLLYSWPGQSCQQYSNIYGDGTTKTASISRETYISGLWKNYVYWDSRQGANGINDMFR